MVKIERRKDSAKKKFDDEVKNFEIVLEARPEISRLGEALGKYKAMREVHDQITELMVESEIEITEFTNYHSFITGIIGKYGDLLAKLEYYRKKCEMEKGLMETPTELGPKPKSNLERIKVPQFTGNIKNYRTWKEYSRAL